jgi:hypothetical protein
MNFPIVEDICFAIYKKKSYIENIDNIHNKMFNLFDGLNINKDANYLLKSICEQRYNIKLTEIISKNLPNNISRIRGPASYYETKDLYVTIATGEPYLTINKKTNF